MQETSFNGPLAYIYLMPVRARVGQTIAREELLDLKIDFLEGDTFTIDVEIEIAGTNTSVWFHREVSKTST
jgi:hypothetical protein